LPAHASSVAIASRVQSSETAAPASDAKASHADEATGQAEPPDEKDEYRISHVTVAVARILKLSPRTTAFLLEILNAAVLFGAIFWFARLKLPVFFRNRSEGLKKQLVDARSATEEANSRLHAIEERLAKLDDEIIAMRQSAERNVLHEEERFRELLEAEKERIVTAAEQEIGSAGDAARRDLKIFAAELAVSAAQERLQVTPELDQQMLDEFLKSLTPESLGGKS
jgi:F-type H+-transporting ATPase subunit b